MYIRTEPWNTLECAAQFAVVLASHLQRRGLIAVRCLVSAEHLPHSNKQWRDAHAGGAVWRRRPPSPLARTPHAAIVPVRSLL
jgi:hypothetical protein